MADVKVTGDPDVVLKVGDVLFPCQREILSQCSPYFQAMFGHNFIEKDQSIIEIQNVEPEAMKTLLEYVRTNEIPRNVLKSNEILSLLQASNMLQFETVQTICVNIIAQEWLSVDTCLQTMATAHVLDLITLYRKAKGLAFWEFSTVKTTSAFFELTIEALEDYLGNDGLNTKQGEFEVFDAGLSWLQEDPDHRKQHILRILECVRFSDISASDIRTMFLYPNVTEDSSALNTLHYVLKMKDNALCCCDKKNFNDSSKRKQSKTSKTARHANDTVIQGSGCCCTNLEHTDNMELCRRQSESSSTNSSQSNDRCLRNCCCIGKFRHKQCWPFCRNSETNTQTSSNPSVDSLSSPNDAVPTEDDCKQNDVELIKGALRLLEKPPRQLPFIPCVIGHKVDPKAKEKINTKNGAKTYVIYFDEKIKQPIPFLFLAKVNEGPIEPTGYKIVNKGQDLYVTGGEYLLGYGNWNSSIWKYSIWQEKWTCETSLPLPRRHHSACIVGDDIYLIGGFGRHRVIMDTVERYNIVSKSWSRRASLPSSMYSAACCVHKGNIYVFGITVCYYHVKEDAWHTFSEPPFPSNMSFNCAMSHQDWIYLTGAYTPQLLRFSPNSTYTDVTGKSNKGYQLLGAFKYRPLCACLANDKIYSFSMDEQGLMAVEAYNIRSNEFQLLWEGSENDANGVADFSPKHCIGCFPLIMY